MKTKLSFVVMAMFSISLFWMSCGEDSNEPGTDEETKSVTIVEAAIPPVASFDINYSSSNCNAPCSVQFTNLSTGGNDNVLAWDFGDGNTAGNSNIPVHTYQTAGTYQVTLTVTNSAGTDTEIGTVTIADSNNYSYVRLYGMEFTITLLPFNVDISDSNWYYIKDDLGQIVASSGSAIVGQPLPINWDSVAV
jgi:PKD repeat protein